MSFVKLKGNRVLLDNTFIQKGAHAPEFTLVSQDLKDHHLASFGKKKKLLYVVPSLDTELCLKSTKYLNDVAKKHEDTAFLIISCDLPFAMKRICSLEKVNHVTPLSMMRDKNFGKDYGILIKEGPLAGLFCRAVIVLDETNKVIYTELVEEITQEPDYENAIRMIE